MQVSTKKEQRAFYKSKRSEIEKTRKNVLDTGVFENFKKFFESCNNKKFLVYVSNDFEVETTRIIEFLIENNAEVAVPRCENGTNVMNFYYISSFSDLEKGYFGILEPDNLCKKVSYTDDFVCLVPALCFDKHGYRIGYGKGFYDRFFSEHKVMLKVGLCYEVFLIDKIITDENDVSVDMIITECNLHERSNYER
ncbi:MAG: 5-formyltetrahydrofolate cyclo-ligase [Ruminococcus sp.]|nr:5-formyltetrahydrofolate cyclo-ligase [Ruminococcus sp.]